MTREPIYVSLVIAGSVVLQVQRDPALRSREDGACVYDEEANTVLFSGSITAVIAWLEDRAERAEQRMATKRPH